MTPEVSQVAPAGGSHVIDADEASDMLKRGLSYDQCKMLDYIIEATADRVDAHWLSIINGMADHFPEFKPAMLCVMQAIIDGDGECEHPMGDVLDDGGAS